MGQSIWSWIVENGGHYFSRDGKTFTETAYPTRVPLFGKFVRGSKMRIGVIKKQDFGVTSEMMKALFVQLDIYWKREVKSRKREISCLSESVVIGFCGGLWGEEYFLASLKVMLTF